MPRARATLPVAPKSPVASCGCGVGHAHDGGTDDDGGRKAVAVDADAKERNRKRLRRIEGQVRGLQRMVDEDRYCADIMTQIASVHEALRAVGRELMRNHLKHCASAAIRGSDADAEAMYDELLELMYRNAR
ncbi:MAG TPA: metal-sensitive transcriptional regulator [Gemmatimonadaceae bacterium]|nr:metal-sensitive transcriptional regulator [Gemmatimonadaceae bacterium]